MRAELEHVKAHNITELDEHTGIKFLIRCEKTFLSKKYVVIYIVDGCIYFLTFDIETLLPCLLSGASSLSRLIRH